MVVMLLALAGSVVVLPAPPGVAVALPEPPCVACDAPIPALLVLPLAVVVLLVRALRPVLWCRRHCAFVVSVLPEPPLKALVLPVSRSCVCCRRHPGV